MSELVQALGRIEREGSDVVVVFDRHYATRPPDLWQACTDPERLARWFAPVSGDLRLGGAFTIHFDDADTPACRVLECAAPHRLVWEWPVKGVSTRVTVEVAADGDGSRLHLRHARLAEEQVPGYAAGWDTYVRCLEAHVGGTSSPDWAATWGTLHELYAGSSA